MKMEPKSTHEPEAKVMGASDVWDDAREIASILKHNLLKAEQLVQLRIPLSTFLYAVENLSREKLLVLHKSIEARLASLKTEGNKQKTKGVKNTPGNSG